MTAVGRQLRHRELGGSGVEVSELALGGAPLAGYGAPVREEDARAAVERAWQLGVRCFDTAPHYGIGLGERRLGAALADKPRAEYTLSTKVGRLLIPNEGAALEGDDAAEGFPGLPATHRREWDFSAAGVRRSLEESLERLGLDRVDLVLIHDPDDHEEQAFREAYPELERMRAEGTVGAIGAGMNQAAMLTRFVRDTDVDAVLLAGHYSLLDQDGLAELLPAAAARGRSVIVGGVYNAGLLADPRPGGTYNYGPAPAPMVAKALRIKEVAARHGVPLRAAALAFPYGHEAVATVLVGVRSAAEAEDALRMFRHPVPAALWEELRAEGLLPAEAPVPGEERP
ncbi:aldo/keto reductase [Streptomyces hoynatensis]|uniref:Aldo/keto reductase n=1 Tax=Streptomyces hoynatensis TaxID=1141874 RepID=A0A3A9Z1M0_9ACTN|nr:aldo/keto reductase [Streptomyces hoynatensis]RKN41296.1 aldo/keto reductase [Streptomyces hoynatensis]